MVGKSSLIPRFPSAHVQLLRVMTFELRLVLGGSKVITCKKPWDEARMYVGGREGLGERESTRVCGGGIEGQRERKEGPSKRKGGLLPYVYH